MLARGGVRPLILERQRETGDAICGGFLSWRTLSALDQLGVTVDGHPVNTVRMTSGQALAEAALPGGAIGVSRRTLDRALQRAAVDQGAALETGITIREADGTHLRLADGAEMKSESLFLATGKYELRGLSRPRDAMRDPTLGLRVRIQPDAALQRLVAGAIELHLFDGGYAGLVLQEDGSANLCLAVRKNRLADAGGNPAKLFAALGAENPHLGERLAFLSPDEPVDSIAAVPYGWRAQETVPGLFRLGDQAAVIPSLAGEGNGIAIASGMAAARAWLADGAAAAPDYQSRFARRTGRAIGTATRLWHAGEKPGQAALAIRVLSAFPALMRPLAQLTRIPD